jgi:GTPase SAR1 family protein
VPISARHLVAYVQLPTGYYRGADGVLLVYDVTEMKSFLNVKFWIERLNSLQVRPLPFLIVGSKCDLDQQRVCGVERASGVYEQQLLTIHSGAAAYYAHRR